MDEKARAGGHGSSEYWLLKDFLAAIRGEKPPMIDVFAALDYSVPGILAHLSAQQGGLPMLMPDFRREG